MLIHIAFFEIFLEQDLFSRVHLPGREDSVHLRSKSTGLLLIVVALEDSEEEGIGSSVFDLVEFLKKLLSN